jgi:hypothetical protein
MMCNSSRSNSRREEKLKYIPILYSLSLLIVISSLIDTSSCQSFTLNDHKVRNAISIAVQERNRII